MVEPQSCPLTEAFILVSAEPNSLWNVRKDAQKIEGVKLARCVVGRFDVIVQAETSNLSWIIARIHALKGVLKTETLITLECDFEK